MFHCFATWLQAPFDPTNSRVKGSYDIPMPSLTFSHLASPGIMAHLKQPVIKVLLTAPDHTPICNLPHKVNRWLRLKYEDLSEAAKFQLPHADPAGRSSAIKTFAKNLILRCQVLLNNSNYLTFFLRCCVRTQFHDTSLTL